ncbi:cupin domain-containing protein [Flavobacterium sp.]|uniref:cupin domain-containing protein n=1 Tax=Flavobacterium sp. TaxID=239 RepID=UPI00286BB4B0|nr:cupin domain-containing protein [Flavobacterium sp.]
MKTIIKKILPLFTAFLLLTSVHIYAQDPVKTAPKNYKKVLLENDNVRVLQFEMAPKEVIPWHTHPNHVIYALSDGKIEITDKGKEAVTMDVKSGDVVFIPAVTHMARNIGSTTIKLIITEIK